MSSRALKMIELVRKAKNIVQNVCPKKATDQQKKNENGKNNENRFCKSYLPSCSTKLFEQDFDVQDIDFDSDNTVLDPDYKISEKDSSFNSETIDMVIDEIGDQIAENEEMGRQIEQNLYRSSSADLENNPNVISKWNRKTSKENRNKGKSYVSVTNKTVLERKLKPLNNCRNKCKDKIPVILPRDYFDKYWSLGTYNQRILYIGSLLSIKNKKTETLNKHQTKSHKRNYHIEYHLEYESNKVKICQKCFRQCFDETESFLKTVVKKKLLLPSIKFIDHRGSNGTLIKLSEIQINTVKEHINSFLAYESHYSRRDTDCRYFHSDLSLSAMYRLYCEKHKSDIVSIGTYSKIFKEMNIKFKKPKIDTCSFCDTIKAKIDIAKYDDNVVELEKFKNELSIHHKKCELSYEAKSNDKLLAQNDSSVNVFTFDLQQCLPTPFLRNSISFYKRQLWTYNLTVHDCVTGRPYCYMWHEAISGRGGNQIASCIFKHINSSSNNPDMKHLIFYRDSCFGQNKNSFVSAMFIESLKEHENLEIIDNKFLEPGHTPMECDSDHALIERKKKKTETLIHHSHDWLNFVRSVGIKKKFSVIEMEKDDFYDFSAFVKLKFTWRINNTEGDRFLWKNIRWIRYMKNEFGKIFYKTSLSEDEPFKILNIGKRGVSKTQICIPKIQYQAKINKKKKKDIQDLLRFINPCFHAFFKSLPTENDDTGDIHPDLVDLDSSEEV